ncbi:MAG: PilX N-terminal domain-containing pilus assembly protein [Candidatus Sulfotelmatobacter sp.]
MGKSTRDSRGFTLIAALLLTVLLSAVAVGLLYLVTNEQRMGGNDLEDNLAFYGAEAGLENLTAQISQLYQTSQTPGAAAITALASPANYPTAISGSNITNMNYVESVTWPATDANGNACPNPCGTWDIVGAGPDQGMVATIIPLNLQVTATRLAGAGEVTNNAAISPTGASVNLTRTVEVALLPAFEFGVFCDGDCDYFAGPNFNFGGRVHTNGNLFLASGSSLTFTDKIAAVNQVVLDQLENGHSTSSGYGGSIYVPDAALGCPPAPGAGPAAFCQQLTAGSWTGGFPPPPSTACAGCGGAANGGWTGISKGTFGGFIETGATGATKLQLPFVQSSKVGAIDILRRPQLSDTAQLTSSRLYTKAEIRILLADTVADLHPDRGAGALGDGQDVQVVLPGAGGSAKLTAGPGAGNYMYYATAQTGANWVAPPSVAGCATPWPLLGEVTAAAACQGVWLRVEYLNNAGNWIGVTTQWLGYGFGRAYDMPPTAPAGNALCPWYPNTPAAQCANQISPAILILQQLQQGVVNSAQAYEATGNNVASATAYKWIPINFYDSREGEPRDNGTRATNTTAAAVPVYTPCSASGIMNAVELDVGNLWLWLQGSAPYAAGSGKLVNSSNQNGYIVYFSDRRGMLPDPNIATPFYNNITGVSGLEDTINSSSAAGSPDAKLEPIAYYPFSPEDVDGNLLLDNWGQKYLGAGFGLVAPYTSQPYFPIPANAVTSNANQISCAKDVSNTLSVYNQAEYNMVTGPRHVLRLVDGGMDNAGTSYLPHPIAPAVFGNGFTIASEEPVYVLGNYNSGPSDPFWPSANNPTTPHSAAAIIADAVTLLSNPPSQAALPSANVGWTDAESFAFPGDVSNRPGNTSYYRVAIAAGKSIPFPQPAWAGQDFGTDGGMHNFLRYLEARGANGATVNYAGSMISMYYSQYATGNFKCCSIVYSPPTRNYFFDNQFLNPNNLPPGTPMFQDIVSLSYHQNFTPQ